MDPPRGEDGRVQGTTHLGLAPGRYIPRETSARHLPQIRPARARLLRSQRPAPPGRQNAVPEKSPVLGQGHPLLIGRDLDNLLLMDRLQEGAGSIRSRKPPTVRPRWGSVPGHPSLSGDAAMLCLRFPVYVLVVISTLGSAGCGGGGVHAPNAQQSLGPMSRSPICHRQPPS